MLHGRERTEVGTEVDGLERPQGPVDSGQRKRMRMAVGKGAVTMENGSKFREDASGLPPASGSWEKRKGKAALPMHLEGPTSNPDMDGVLTFIFSLVSM